MDAEKLVRYIEIKKTLDKASENLEYQSFECVFEEILVEIGYYHNLQEISLDFYKDDGEGWFNNYNPFSEADLEYLKKSFLEIISEGSIKDRQYL